MQYCTTQDLDNQALGVDLITPQPPYTYQSVQAAINDASALIDSYLATRYQMPIILTSVPADVVYTCAELAWCILNTNRGFEPGAGSSDNWFATRYNNALARLSSWANDRVHPQLNLLDLAIPTISPSIEGTYVGSGGNTVGSVTGQDPGRYS